MKTDTQNNALLEQQLALGSYLGALLTDVVLPSETAVEVRQMPEVPAPAEAGVQAEAEIPAEVQVQAEVHIPAARQTPPEVQSPPGIRRPTAPGPGLCVEGVPEWAQARFQALLFEVAGLTLAVPLAKLKGVVTNENGLTEMPGHSALFLGVTPYQGMQSKVVDTARFVLPKDRAAQRSEDATDRAAHLVVIDEGRWALACSKIGEVIELQSEQVKWRSAAGKRRWLAGTVIEQMCALLDVDELAQQLVDGMA